MKNTRLYTVLWLVASFFFLIVGVYLYVDQQRMIMAPSAGDVSVTDITTAAECVALDSNNDGRVTIVDFANFALNYGRQCTIPQTASSEFNPIFAYTIRHEVDSEINLGDYSGIEISIGDDDSPEGGFDIVGYAPPTSGWLGSIGICNSLTPNVFFANDTICAALVKPQIGLSIGDTLGTAYSNRDEQGVIFSDAGFVSIDYSDGEVIVNQDSVRFDRRTSSQLVSIDLPITSEIVGNGNNGLSLDITSNTPIVAFSPSEDAPLLVLPCEGKNDLFVTGANSMCAAYTSTSDFSEGDIVGTLIFEVPISGELELTYGLDAQVSDGADSVTVLSGEYFSYSAPEGSTVCRYVDLNEDGEVGIQDLAAFAGIFGKELECRTQAASTTPSTPEQDTDVNDNANGILNFTATDQQASASVLYRGNDEWEYEINANLPSPCYSIEVVPVIRESSLVLVVTERFDSTSICTQATIDVTETGVVRATNEEITALTLDYVEADLSSGTSLSTTFQGSEASATYDGTNWNYSVEAMLPNPCYSMDVTPTISGNTLSLVADIYNPNVGAFCTQATVQMTEAGSISGASTVNELSLTVNRN